MESSSAFNVPINITYRTVHTGFVPTICAMIITDPEKFVWAEKKYLKSFENAGNVIDTAVALNTSVTSG